MTFTDVHTDRQKLGTTILEKKVVQKYMFSKNDNNKKTSSKLIFFNEKKIREIRIIFDIENWLWMSDLGTFWQPMWTSVKVKSKNYFSFTDFFSKIKPLLTEVCKTPPLRSYYPLYSYSVHLRYALNAPSSTKLFWTGKVTILVMRFCYSVQLVANVWVSKNQSNLTL